MDWQILAALVVCVIALIGYVLMGPGKKRTTETPEPEIAPPAPLHAQKDAKVDAAVLARFNAALQEIR